MRDAPLALLWAVAAASCSYDWTVGHAKADGGTDASEAAPLLDCNTTQEAAVQQARSAALVCTGVTPNPCQVLVTDECGCPVYVAAQNQAEAQYTAAIKLLRMTCTPSCPTACGPAPSPGVCIVSDAGSGALACYQ